MVSKINIFPREQKNHIKMKTLLDTKGWNPAAAGYTSKGFGSPLC